MWFRFYDKYFWTWKEKSGNIYIGTGINPSLGHSKIDLNIEKIKRLREKNFTTEQIAKELSVSTSVIEKRVNEEGMPKVSNKKISSERLKFLDIAAKKYGFKDFASVKGRNNRLNIAKEATRREKNISEGRKLIEQKPNLTLFLCFYQNKYRLHLQFFKKRAASNGR